MTAIFSFDVFDTALIRRVALPTDIFRLIARELALEDGRADDLAVFEEEFVSARITAEDLARAKAAPREDCTLEAIWDELRRLLPALPAAATAELEVRIERENILANPNLSGRIRELTRTGQRVLFISDIFHSRATVFDFLSRAGLAASIDQVFVSSEAGLLKSTGNLFRHVAQAVGASPGDFVHQGDHPISDGVAARKAGLRTLAYAATRLNAAEKTVLAAFADDFAGSRLAAAMRIARLAERDDGRASLVPAFLGPLAVLLAGWALAQAERRGVRRLYFVARDGHIPWRAAVELAEAYPGIESRYVKLSRHSLAAALPKLGDFGAFWIARSWSKLPLADIADRLGHSWEAIAPEVTEALPRAGRDYLLADAAEIDRFVAVLDGIALRGEPTGPRRERREAVLQHLRQEGLLDGEPFLIVDVGWFLNLQAALKAVIDDNGATGFRGGLYLGLRNGRVADGHAGPARALIYEQPFAHDLPDDANTVFDRMILFEHLLGLAPHGSAKGYAIGDGGRATTIEGPIPPDRRLVVDRVSDEVGAFAALLAPFARDFHDEAALRRAVLALSEQVLAAPAAYDLAHLGQLDREDDSADQPPMRITEPWRLTTVLGQAVPYRLRSRLGWSHGPTLWPEASLAATGRVSRTALGMVRGLRRSAGRLLRPSHR